MGYIEVNGRKIKQPVSRVLIAIAAALIFSSVAAAVVSAVLIQVGIALAAGVVAAAVILVVGPVVAGLVWLSNRIEKASKSDRKKGGEIVQDCRSSG